jgi:hypothetical protein
VRTAATAGDDDLLARALTLWEVPTIWSPRDYARRDDDIVSRVERLLAAPVETGSDAAAAERRCRLLCVLAVELEGEDGDRAEAASAEAVRLARVVGDPELICQALTARALAVSTHSLVEERRRIAAELAELGERHNHVPYQVFSHYVAVQACAADGAGIRNWG